MKVLDTKFHDLDSDRVSFVYEPAFLRSFKFLFRLSLVEYFCTHGSLTLVAGEAHEQICFGSCCMSVVQCDDDK